MPSHGGVACQGLSDCEGRTARPSASLPGRPCGLAVALYVLLSPLRIMAAYTFHGRSSDPSPRPRSRLEAAGRPTTLGASAS